MSNKHPIQPTELDNKGVLRFKENKIVRDILDLASKHGLDLNVIHTKVAMGMYDVEDQIQLTQLIGYSISGACDLSYMPDSVINKANRQAKKNGLIK